MFLRYKADRRTLGFVATYFALLIVGWIAWPMAWYVAVPFVIVLSCFSWFCAVITHNTIHCAVFKQRRLNKAFQVVLTLTYGHPVSSFVSGHNLSHHRYTQQDRDAMRTTKVRYKGWNLIAFLMFFPIVSGKMMRTDITFARAMFRQRPRWFRQFIIEAAFFVGVSVLLFVIDWEKALFLWLLPHFWASWGIISINYFQHDGCDPDSEYNHSRNFVGRVFGWWTFNNGFHSIHHKHPNLHWSLLREAHDREFTPHMHPALAQRSIFVYAFRSLIWPGKRERFDGAPLDLGPDLPDRSWIPARRDDMPDVSLGAEA